MPKLIFLIGISGSGKSTYIKKHFKPEVVVSPDDLRRKITGDVTDHSQEGRVWATVPVLLKKKLEKYGEAVLDATNVDSGSRKGILKKFSRDLVERVAIVFEADPEESKRRIKADLAAGKDRSDVPDDVVDKQQLKFQRGFNSIKQQFDKVIYVDRGDNVMSNKTQKEDIQKLRMMIAKEMKLLKEEDAKEAMERAEYQAYQDMYLTPQSNWRVKKYTEMYDGDGKLYRGKIGEVHRIQTVEYDFMHTGEVVTECGGMTYSLNAEDFRNSFEMINDEEGLKVNNESIIKEEIKKLVKVKDYFGKTIKESIEKLEKTFLGEDSDDDYLEQDFDDRISEPGYDDVDNRLWQPVFPGKTEGRYMIYSDSTDKDFGESFGTIPAAESRIEELEKEFGRNSFFIKDRTTGREV